MLGENDKGNYFSKILRYVKILLNSTVRILEFVLILLWETKNLLLTLAF